MLPGVVHIVGLGKRPVPVDEDELESLRIVVSANLPVRPEPDYVAGQAVSIKKGPLAGANGVVIGSREQRLMVAISLLQRSVSVELDRDWLDPLETASVSYS
jgi:transcriptional antiterminator NusG